LPNGNIPHRNNGTGWATGPPHPDRRTADLTDAARELLARRHPVSHPFENVMSSADVISCMDIAR
jgi:hypothetical protein